MRATGTARTKRTMEQKRRARNNQHHQPSTFGYPAGGIVGSASHGCQTRPSHCRPKPPQVETCSYASELGSLRGLGRCSCCAFLGRVSSFQQHSKAFEDSRPLDKDRYAMLSEEEKAAYEELRRVVARLRAADGCPWDREQTHASLRPYVIEEAYEVLEALDSNSTSRLPEELGDLLFQVVLHAQLAEEAGEFSMTDVLQGLGAKLVRRHPHVFGDVRLETSQ